MEASENSIKLYYNTEVEKLQMPEYGRNVLRMVEQLKDIPDRQKRTEQAYAVVKVMESLNPQVHQQENFAQKLWDHLFIIAGYDLDVEAPFPKPTPEVVNSRPDHRDSIGFHILGGNGRGVSTVRHTVLGGIGQPGIVVVPRPV